MSGVDVGEQRLILVEHWFCGEEWQRNRKDVKYATGELQIL